MARRPTAKSLLGRVCSMLARYAKLLIVIAILTLTPAQSGALSVKDFVIRLIDPKTQLATEDFSVAVSQGFFWYSAAVAEKSAGKQNVLCFPENRTLGRSTILQAANRGYRQFKWQRTI